MLEHHAAGPTLWAFHSFGASADEALFAGRVVCAAHGWGVLAPQGPLMTPDGGRQWVDDDGSVRDLAALVSSIPGFCAAALGLSQGCLAAVQALGRRTSAAVLMVPVGLVPEVVAPRLSGCDILVVTGAQDELSPPLVIRSLSKALAERGASVEVFEHGGGHYMTAQALLVVSDWLRVRSTRTDQ